MATPCHAPMGDDTNGFKHQVIAMIRQTLNG
jgi:hypothetical protein